MNIRINYLKRIIYVILISFYTLVLCSCDKKIEEINFLTDNDSVVIGDYISLDYNIKPIDSKAEGDIEIDFNDPNLVEIANDNKYIALSEGKLIATIKYNGNSFGQKTINIEPLKLEKYIVSDTNVVLNNSIDLDIEHYPLNATHYDYVLKSLDPDIAKIVDNKIYGVSEGETSVIVSSKDDSVSNSFIVSVKEVLPNEILFTSINSEYILGDSDHIDVSFKPEIISNNEYELISSNTKVIKIDGNNIEAISAGTSILKAQCSNGVSCEKVIKVLYPLLKNVDITTIPSSDIEAGKTYQLKYEYSPNPASYANFEWESSDETVAKVNSKGLVTAVSEGTAIITIISDKGIKDSVTINVSPKKVVASSGGGSVSNNSSGGGSGHVYVTSKGKKYHSYAGCSNMKSPIEISLDEAISRGYTKCKKCW